jgi:hypothetical protein
MVTLTSGWSPNIGDVILNEINFGETPYASGHAYLSADINGHNRAGNYAFQISTTSNFTHATTVAVTSSHSTLDVANGFRDYHVDITLTDYQVGTLYWRATAIDTADGASPNDPGGYRTTSKTASFTNNSGPPAFASNPQDVGATGGDSAASNSGFGSGPSSAPPSSDPSTIIGSPTDVAAAACLLYAGSALDTPGTCSADALYSAEQSGELSATSAGNNFGLQMDRLRAATNLTQAVCDSYDSGNTGSPTPYMTDVTLGSNSSFAWSFPNGDYLVMGNLPTGLDLSTTSEPAYSWDLNGYNVATHQDLTCNPVGASYNYYGFPQGTWGYWYGAYYENGTATTGCPNVVGGASYSYTGVANGPNDGLLSADAQTTSSGQTAYCLSPNPGNPFYSNWQFNSATKPVIDQQYLASSHFSFTNTHTPPPAGVPVLAVTTNPSVPTTFGPNLFYILNGYVDSSVPTVSANLVTQLETGNYPDVVEFLNWKLGTGGSPFS